MEARRLQALEARRRIGIAVAIEARPFRVFAQWTGSPGRRGIGIDHDRVGRGESRGADHRRSTAGLPRREKLAAAKGSGGDHVAVGGGQSLGGTAGPGAYLAVSATESVDMEAVSFRLQELVQRLGKELTIPPRGGMR